MDKKVGWEYEWAVPKSPPEEGKRRHRLIREQMGLRNIDCLIVAGNSGNFRGYQLDIRYVSNWAAWFDPNYIVFPFEGEPLLLVFNPGHKLLSEAIGFMEAKPFNRGRWGLDFVGSIVQRIRELGLEKSTIGITPMRWMAAQVFLGLTEQLPEAKFIDASDLIRQIRMIKSPLEMEFIRKAGECADKGFEAMLAAARPGAKEAELGAACESAMVINGAEMGPHLLIGSGSWETRSASITLGGSQRILKKGDIILNEITACYGGYSVQLCRPISIGTPPDDFMELYGIHCEMYKLVRDKLRPGNRIEDIEAEVAELARQKGKGRFGKYVWALQSGEISDTGIYSIKGELKAGMSFVNHPFTEDASIRQGHSGIISGHTIGDTYIIHEDRAECVNKLPFELSII